MATAHELPTISTPAELDAVQFGMKSLFLLTLLCAAGIALVKQLDMIGAVIIFVAAGGGTIIMHCLPEFRVRRFWFHALWGILLPICCLVTDPLMVFRNFELSDGTLSPYSFGCYSFISWQMLMLCVSWFLKPSQPLLNSFVSGNLFAGTLFAALIGLILVIPAFVFSFFLLMGSPGFTPLLTMLVFFDGSQQCWENGSTAGETPRLRLAALGCMFSVAIGLAAYEVWSL